MLALIYRGVADYTTGVAFERALNYLDVPFIRLDNNDIHRGAVSLENFDAALVVDDGFGLKNISFPNLPANNAYYCIDWHAERDAYLPYLHPFKTVYAAQYTYGYLEIQALGINAKYLPLAWDNLGIPYQPMYVQDVQKGERQVRDIPVSFICSRTTERRWYLSEIVRGKYNGETKTRFGYEMGLVYSSSKLALNDFGGVGEWVNEKDVNLRLYEVMGCGALLLQREFPFPDAEALGLHAAEGWFRNVKPTGEHFWDRRPLRGDENYVSWKSASQLFQTIEYYLDPANEQERNEIAERGRQWAQKQTFVERVKVILNDLGYRV